MSLVRSFLALLISFLLLLSAPGGSATASASSTGQLITLTGKLEFVTTIGVPHYEVNGYVLVYSDAVKLSALNGADVVVQGAELNQPSLFMRKAISVQTLATEPLLSGESSREQREITTPIAPDPSLSLPPGGGNQISIPAPPVPFYGTTFHLLFGRVVFTGGKYFVVEPASSGEVRTWITGSTVHLSALTNKQIGAVAARETLQDGTIRFRIYQAIVLSDDLADQIRANTALIYVAPAGEITVRLRGRIVNMDQSPVIGNGRTLVGLRAIAEALGAQISWDGASRTATVRLGDREVVVQVGSNRVVVHQIDQPDLFIHNDIAPAIVSGRTMVPARVLSEGLGLQVTWTAETRTVDLR